MFEHLRLRSASGLPGGIPVSRLVVRPHYLKLLVGDKQADCKMVLPGGQLDLDVAMDGGGNLWVEFSGQFPSITAFGKLYPLLSDVRLGAPLIIRGKSEMNILTGNVRMGDFVATAQGLSSRGLSWGAAQLEGAVENNRGRIVFSVQGDIEFTGDISVLVAPQDPTRSKIFGSMEIRPHVNEGTSFAEETLVGQALKLRVLGTIMQPVLQ